MRRWEMYLVGQGWRSDLMVEGDEVVVETEMPVLVALAFSAGEALEVRRARAMSEREVRDGA